MDMQYGCVMYWKQAESGTTPLSILAYNSMKGCKGQKRSKTEKKAHTPAAQEQPFEMQEVTTLSQILVATTSWYWHPNEKQIPGYHEKWTTFQTSHCPEEEQIRKMSLSPNLEWKVLGKADLQFENFRHLKIKKFTRKKMGFCFQTETKISPRC